MSVSDVRVEKKKPELGHEAFAANKSELEKLSPGVTSSEIRFTLTKANASVANAVRFAAVQESVRFSFRADINQLETSEPYILKNELIDRIGFICVDQQNNDEKTMREAKFEINEKNNSELPVIVKSSAIKTTNSKQVKFDQNTRIAILQPGKSLKLSGIVIEEGYGYENAKFNNAVVSWYDTVEYTDVKILKSPDNIAIGVMKKDELAKKIKGKKYTGKEKICVIRKKEFLSNSMEETKKEIRKCDIVILSRDIQTKSSMTCSPVEFEMGFEFYGDCDPEKAMTSSLKQLGDRIKELREKTAEFAKSGEPQENVEFEVGDPLSTMLVRGEDHAIGNLLSRRVFELDPEIKLVNMQIIHPSNRMFQLNIIHAQPLKIIEDALKSSEETVREIMSGFEK